MFHTTRYATYILSAMQALNRIGRLDRIIADDRTAELISKESCEDYHPAILKVNRKAIERPYLPLELSDDISMPVNIYGFRNSDYDCRKSSMITARLGKKAFFGHSGCDHPIREIKAKIESYKFLNGFIGGPVLNVKTGHAIGVFMCNHTGQSGFSICLETLKDMPEIWRYLPRAILKNNLHPYANGRDFKIRFCMIAMTRDEAHDLSSGRIFGRNGSNTQVFKRFQSVQKSLRMRHPPDYYGSESVHWQPIKGDSLTITDLIRNIAKHWNHDANPHYKIEPEFAGVESLIDSSSDLWTAPNETTIFIIDPISLFHPKYKKINENQQSAFKEQNTPVIVLSPISSANTNLKNAFSDLLYNLISNIIGDASTTEPQYDFNEGDVFHVPPKIFMIQENIESSDQNRSDFLFEGIEEQLRTWTDEIKIG